jgi:hypothetical protein
MFLRIIVVIKVLQLYFTLEAYVLLGKISNMSNKIIGYGIWWDIAGAGWVSYFPEHHNQLEMFGGCVHNSYKHTPLWGGKPLIFDKDEATKLAEDWSTRGNGRYVVREITKENYNSGIIGKRI